MKAVPPGADVTHFTFMAGSTQMPAHLCWEKKMRRKDTGSNQNGRANMPSYLNVRCHETAFMGELYHKFTFLHGPFFFDRLFRSLQLRRYCRWCRCLDNRKRGLTWTMCGLGLASNSCWLEREGGPHLFPGVPIQGELLIVFLDLPTEIKRWIVHIRSSRTQHTTFPPRQW